MVNPQDLLPSSRRSKVHDLDSAIKWIEGGNSKESHRFLYDGYLYVYKDEDGSAYIASTWAKDQPLLRYHPDDTVTVGPFPNGYLAPSLKRKLAAYANMHSLKLKGKTTLLVTLANASQKPTKLVRCKQCSGMGKHTVICDGEDGYRIIITASGKEFRSYYNCTRNNSTNSHREIFECNNCTGTGKVSWGGKLIPTEWDATKPLRMKIVTGEILEENTTN